MKYLHVFLAEAHHRLCRSPSYTSICSMCLYVYICFARSFASQTFSICSMCVCRTVVCVAEFRDELAVAHHRLRRCPSYTSICSMCLYMHICGAPSFASPTFSICSMCLYLHICFAPSFASQSFQICLAHTQTYIHTRASSLTPHLNSPAAPVSEHSPITHPSFQLQQTCQAHSSAQIQIQQSHCSSIFSRYLSIPVLTLLHVVSLYTSSSTSK